MIQSLIVLYENVARHYQHDEFLHKVQQEKIAELWNNQENEAWENV